MKIKITDPAIASEIGNWCTENFGNFGWDLSHHNILTANPGYVFEILEEKNATLFMLKWGEYA